LRLGFSGRAKIWQLPLTGPTIVRAWGLVTEARDGALRFHNDGKRHEVFFPVKGQSYGQYNDYPDSWGRVVCDHSGRFDSAPPHSS